MSCPPALRKQPRRYPLAMLLVAALVYDFLAQVAVLKCLDRRPTELLLFTHLAVVAGQGGLLTVWAVLGPVRHRVQWPLALLFLVAGFWSLLAGFAVTGRGGDWIEPVRLMLSLPLLFTMGQIPFWAMWLLGGVRIVRRKPGDATAVAAMRQTGIKQLMGAMVAVALLLALARQGVPVNPRHGEAQDDLTHLLISGLVWGAGSAVLGVPCLWAALGARRAFAGLAALAIYAPLVSFVPAAINAVYERGVPREEWLKYPPLFVIVLTVVVYLPLLLARRCGYVVVGLSRGRPIPAEAAGPIGQSPFPAPPPRPPEQETA